MAGSAAAAVDAARVGRAQRAPVLLAIVALALVPAVEVAHATGDRSSSAACTLEPGQRRAVARIVDAETLALDDGSEVRLVGALAPRSPFADQSAWPPERAARAALESLVAGQSVELAFAGRRADRYGRLLAHVFVIHGSERTWVQGRMLAEGHARAYALPQSEVCTAELLAHEAVARRSRRGLWASAAYRVLAASRTFELLRHRGTFQLVEGVLTQVFQTRSRTYLNFGPDWRSDFTIGIAGSVVAAGQRRDLKELEGSRVRVRGWIERRNGPYIELHDLALLEVVTDDSRDLAGARSARDAVAEPEAEAAPSPPGQKSPARRAPGGIDL